MKIQIDISTKEFLAIDNDEITLQIGDKTYVAKVTEEPEPKDETPTYQWVECFSFEDYRDCKCSGCGVHQLFLYGRPNTPYCPNCGSLMEKRDCTNCKYSGLSGNESPCCFCTRFKYWERRK